MQDSSLKRDSVPSDGQNKDTVNTMFSMLDKSSEETHLLQLGSASASRDSNREIPSANANCEENDASVSDADDDELNCPEDDSFEDEDESDDWFVPLDVGIASLDAACNLTGRFISSKLSSLHQAAQVSISCNLRT